MNYKYAVSVRSSFPQITPDLGMDPVLTYAISGDEGGYHMDVTKQDEDEGSEPFGTHYQSQNCYAGFPHLSNTLTSGPVASSSSNFAEPRLLRLSSNEFQTTEDLQTSFNDLSTPEDVSPGQYCFSRPVERVSTQLEDFEEENGFDSGFGSLQLTPTEIQSDAICESSSLQSTPFWGTSAKESTLGNEEQTTSSSFSSHLPSQQAFQFKRCSTVLEISAANILEGNVKNNDFTMKYKPKPGQIQGVYYLNGTLPSSQPYRQINRDSSLNNQMSSTALYSKPSVSSMPPVMATHTCSSSSSSSNHYEISRSARSPVSHRNLNKRVVQQEASEFLSSSEGGNWEESFDDIENFGTETDFDENAFSATNEIQSSSHKGCRNCQAFPLRRGQHGPLAGSNHRRSRSAVFAAASFERPRRTGVSHNGGRKRNLLNFILELLTTRQTCVEWVDKPKQVFQIVNPDQLTRLWGEHKNNIKMSFDSLSRSLRLYYKPGKLERIPGTRHQYRLIQKPQECPDIHRGSPYGRSSEHRKSGVSINYSNSLKQQSTLQKPYL